MMRMKQGFPEEGDLVMCKVTSVQHHSVFTNLEEYRRTGLIHISEVSPGRIRNIRDYVKEGKIIVCKVLRINQERGHIDLSLRRVTESQRRLKVNEIKQEQKAEKILEMVAKRLKLDAKEAYDKICKPAFDNYDSLYSCFEEVISNEDALKEAGFPKELIKPLVDDIKQKIKPPEVKIGGNLYLTSYASDGVEVVKAALKKTIEVNKEKIEIQYKGGGKFGIIITSGDYKTAEKLLKDATDIAIAAVSKEGEGSFERE